MRTKVIALLLSTVVVAASIIGCGNKDAQNSDNAQTEAAEQVQETTTATDSAQETSATTESTETTENATLATFEELINSLHAGQSYVYAPICGGENALLVTSYTFDDLEGHQATYEATIYIQKADSIERVTTVQSSGTAYPIAVSKDNSLMVAMRNSVQKAYVDKETGKYVVTEEANIKYTASDEDNYHNYSNGTVEITSDSSLYDKLSDEYYDSEILSFEHADLLTDGAPNLAGAVYAAYRGDDLYNVAFYIAFDSENSGYTQTPDGMTGLPFAYEANGEDMVFHFGSADDVSEAKLGYEYASFPTLTFKEGGVYGADVFTLTCIGCADPENFDAVKYYDNDNNLYMYVSNCDTTTLTGNLFRKEIINKENVENAEVGSLIFSVNGTQYKVVSFEDVKEAIGYSSSVEDFIKDVAGISRIADFLVQDTEDNSYYALEKRNYDDNYKVVAMMHEEDIMKRIEDNVTFKIKENCEITLQKFVSDGENMNLEEEYLIGREFKGTDYPSWSAAAEEYYMTDGMLVTIGVIDGELYNIVQIYVP